MLVADLVPPFANCSPRLVPSSLVAVTVAPPAGDRLPLKMATRSGRVGYGLPSPVAKLDSVLLRGREA